MDEIVALDGQGRTQAAIAGQVGVSSFSVRQVLRDRQPRATVMAGEHEQEQQEQGLAVVPAPTPRAAERQAARFGQLEEAAPVVTPGRALPLAGLLLALPALAATGLLEVAEQSYGKLKNGFYGLRSILLVLVLLALLREPRAEGATRGVPGDLGRILALDRAPEVSTIRRRLAELAERGQAGQLMGALARRHVDAHPEAVAFLYVDGHVRAYHGTRALPKAHVARMRISRPATLETWIADATAIPSSPSWPHPRPPPPPRCAGCYPTCASSQDSVAQRWCSTEAAGPRSCSPTYSTRASTCSPTARAPAGLSLLDVRPACLGR